MAFVISVILIRQPQNTVESHHIHLKQKNFLRFNGVFYYSNYLNVCTCFWFVFFETLFSLYTSAKANYAPGDISIAIVGGGVAGAVFQIFFLINL